MRRTLRAMGDEMIDRSEVHTAEFPAPRDVEQPEEPRPFSARVKIDVAALSHKGKARESNEDHYYVGYAGRSIETLLTNVPEGEVPEHFDEAGYVILVADGMGGVVGGEIASCLAIRTLINIIIHVPDWILRVDDEHAQEVMKRAAQYFRQVNAALVERAEREPRLKGMGTTMTAAYSVGDDLFVAHVGDSRAYLFRDGRLRRLTRDQTHAQMLADAGIIGQDEVASHRLRHVLTNSLGGTDAETKVELQRLKLCDGDCLLLCSDGLTDMVEDDTIGSLLSDNRASDDGCLAVVLKALENGGKDNVTVVLQRYSIPDD